MARVLLIADDDTRWPEPTRPPAELVRTDRFLRIHLRTITEFRSLVRETRPDVVHADGPAAVRVASLLTRFAPSGHRPRVLASAAADPPGGVTGWLTRRGLCNADRVIARSRVEADRYHSLGVERARVTLIPFGAEESAAPDPVAFRRSLDIPDSASATVPSVTGSRGSPGRSGSTTTASGSRGVGTTRRPCSGWRRSPG
jgi:hypothetical protein